MQGEIYLGETLPGHPMVSALESENGASCRVVIKRTSKELHRQKISMEEGDDMRYVVDEDIVKEAIMLSALTRYILKFHIYYIVHLN